MPENKDDIELRSESVRDILTRVPPWLIRWGNLLFLLLLFSVLTLSWLIKYPDTLKADALLTTKRPPQPIYARISAPFDTIIVADNESVSEDQVLAILENSSNSKDVFYLKGLLDTIHFSQTKIEFPFDKLPLLFLGEIEPDFARFENSYFSYLNNKAYNPVMDRELANTISLNELEKRLSNIQFQKEIAQYKLDIEKKDLERNQELFGKGVISKQEVENKQSEFYTELRNLQNLEANESQIRQSIANASNELSDDKFSKSNEELKLVKEVIQSYHTLKKSIKDWELKYVLSSKINGRVSFLEYWSKNQSVEAGNLVFKVLPNNDADYIVKLNVEPQNMGKVKTGQLVNISLWDFPEYEFGVIQGKIKTISRTTDSKGFYRVDVSIPNKLISSYGKKLDFRQEMRGSADIILEDLRLIERLLYQFRELFQD